MECMLDHIVLNVSDDAAMLSFYSEVLMLTPERVAEYRAGSVPFPSVRLNADTIIDLFPKRMWHRDGQGPRGTPNLNHLCIALEKGPWEALWDRLRSNGVAIEEGPVPRWGARGTGKSIYFRDPEGNLIEARCYEEKDGSEPCLLGS